MIDEICSVRVKRHVQGFAPQICAGKLWLGLRCGVDFPNAHHELLKMVIAELTTGLGDDVRAKGGEEACVIEEGKEG